MERLLLDNPPACDRGPVVTSREQNLFQGYQDAPRDVRLVEGIVRHAVKKYSRSMEVKNAHFLSNRFVSALLSDPFGSYYWMWEERDAQG